MPVPALAVLPLLDSISTIPRLRAAVTCTGPVVRFAVLDAVGAVCGVPAEEVRPGVGAAGTVTAGGTAGPGVTVMWGIGGEAVAGSSDRSPM